MPQTHARTHKFILFSHHQFYIRLLYVPAVQFLGVDMKFLTMLFSRTVVFHLCGQFSTKYERIQFSRYTPLAWMTLHALPRGMKSELSQSKTHKHCSCIEERITEFSAHFQFWKGITVPENTDKLWGAGAKSLQHSDGCGHFYAFVHVFVAFLGFL